MKEENREIVQTIGELANVIEKAAGDIAFRLSELEKFIDNLSIEIHYLRNSLEGMRESLSTKRSKKTY